MHEIELLQRSAERGNVWAQTKLAKTLDENDALLEKAAAQGEPDAFVMLADVLINREDDVFVNPRPEELLHEAALLGDARAQCLYGDWFCPRDSPEKFAWLRRSLAQNYWRALPILSGEAAEQLRRFQTGGSAECVFEIGTALGNWNAKDYPRSARTDAMEKTQRLHRQWCEEARKGIWCWLWLGKQFQVGRDVRRLIADLVWEQRVGASAKYWQARKRKECCIHIIDGDGWSFGKADLSEWRRLLDTIKTCIFAEPVSVALGSQSCISCWRWLSQ